jgi:flagellar biosynthesis chaperone FliJ
LGRSLIPGVSKENVLPTSEKIMEKRKELHPELEPRGKREELQQEIIGDYLLQPGGPGKKLAISAAQTFAKELAKDLGGGEKVQAGTKIITGILASRSGKPNVKDFIKKEYEEASKAIPKNATISGSRAESYLSQVKEKVNQGGHAAWKNDVNAQINALEKSIHSGKIKVTALDQSIKDINSQLMEKGVRGSQAEMWLTRIKQAAQHELKQYGKSNPEFLKHYKDANASFAGYKQSLIGQKQIEKFKEAGLFKGTVGLLAHGIANPEASMQALGSLAALYGIKKSGELTQRIFSSPVLASHYMKAIASAAKENAPQTIANLSKLDQELRKSNQNFPNKQSK